MALSKDNYELLKEKYGSEMERVYKLNYTRNMTTLQRKELGIIYEQTFNEPPTNILSSCNSCLYQGLLRLAKAYYQYKSEDNFALGTIDGLPVPDDTTPAPKQKTDKKTTTKKK